MTERARRPLGRQGQALPVIVVFLPVLLGAVGIAVDGSRLFAVHREMQSAAELSALAAAQDLPAAPSTTAASARHWAAENGFVHEADTRRVAVATPFEKDEFAVEVTLRYEVPTLFLGILGFRRSPVTVRAVARKSTQDYAIFAGEGDCTDPSTESSIDWTGGSARISGKMHVNSGMKMSGSNNTFQKEVTYSCTTRISGGGNTFAQGLNRTPPKEYPIRHELRDFPCDFSGVGGFDVGANGPWWEGGDRSSRTLRPGVYCSEGGTLKLSTSGVSGRVTFVSTGGIDLSGSKLDLQAYRADLLAFSTRSGDKAIKVSGSGGRWIGAVYAPAGEISISGSGNMVAQGGMIGRTVKVTGSSFTLQGSSTGSRVRLIQ